MKQLYILFSLFFSISFSFAQNEFITTWTVDSGDYDISIQTNTSNYMYNYSVDFGDGTILNNVTGNAAHTYSQTGVYTVKISGDFPYFATPLLTDYLQLKSIEQWGNIQWASMRYAFSSCSNLVVNATDSPDLSQVTDMSNMFSNCTNFNQPLNSWDVSNVTNMSDMFKSASSFNQDINNWDVSNVTDMSRMFNNATSFNQPLNNWDVSNVISMSSMFSGANSFNQSLDNWNVSNVPNMNEMFKDASSFNQDINNWDVSNVIYMQSMFSGANSFNQSLDNWNVSNVPNMNEMFKGASSFNQDINNWDVSNVINMESMFKDCINFNQPLNNWDVSSVVTMISMFSGCSVFNQDINNWDVSNVKYMELMFSGCSVFNQPLNNWDVSSVLNMKRMFSTCSSFNQPLNNWNVSSVFNMNLMFSVCSAFNQPLNSWDVSSVTDIGGMFNRCSTFNQALDNWDVSSVTSFYGMFFEAFNFNQDLSSWDFSNNNSIGFPFLEFFLDETGLSIYNYEKFLYGLLNSGTTNATVGVQGLEYCNVNLRSYLQSQNLIFNYDILSSNCNTISGTVNYDANNNGCDVIDIEISNLFVNAQQNANNYTSGSILNAAYSISVNAGSYDVTMQNVPTYFTVNPVSTTVDFATTSNEVVDFCLTANQVVEDLNITILPIDEARPGFEANYKVLVANVGTEVMTNVIASLNFDNTKQSFVSAIPAATSTTANSLDFNLSTINPFETIEIDIVMQTFTPPTVNGDDILNFTATVLPNTSDFTIDDNTFVINQIVVNAYDPNDKRVVQGEEITLDQTDEYLDYIIRFQNTGSANATFVRIEEQLDPELDWSTIKITSASHPYTVSITNGNDVEYYFDNINLPFEAADPAGSNGYIAYKIKPESTVQVGDVMSGDASIYFDYNLPIITNVASTTVISNLSVEEFKLESLVSIYPNPVKNELFLNVKNGVTVNTVKVYDLQGHMLLETKAEANRINTEQLATGIYMLTINTNQGNLNKKIIKN